MSKESTRRGGPLWLALTIILLFAVAGYGIGSLIVTMTKEKKTTAKTYIAPSDNLPQDGTFTAENMLSLGRLGDPQLSPDGKRVLYGVSYTDIAQNRSCRNLFLSNTDGSDKVQLTRSGSSISCARWSGDGAYIYYICEGQIWRAPLRGSRLGKAVKVSDISAGVSEFKLSPDGSKILYISSIPGPVKQPSDFDPALDKAGAYVTENLMYRHWDHWVTETPRTFVAALDGKKITPEASVDLLCDEPYELPTEPFGGAEQLDWSPDGRYIAYSCRKLVGKQYAFSTNTGI